MESLFLIGKTLYRNVYMNRTTIRFIKIDMNFTRNILITGGAGFIGSHVVRLFVNKYPEYHIINLDKLTYAGNLANLKDVEDQPNYTFVKADICDFDKMLEIFKQYHIDGVIHLAAEFEKLPCTIKLFPSDANFFLAKVTDAVKIYNYLVGEGIIVRNRHNISLCCNCLRVTVGTRVENNTLLATLKKYPG